MTVGWRSLLLALVAVSGSALFLLRADPEAEVRAVHEDLRQLVAKAEGESAAATLIGMRALQALFAGEIVIAGEADALAGRHTAQELAATVVRLRELFVSVELGFAGLDVTFPEPGIAVGEFTAVLTAQRGEGDESAAGVTETRTIRSTLTDASGEWRFSQLELSLPAAVD